MGGCAGVFFLLNCKLLVKVAFKILTLFHFISASTEGKCWVSVRTHGQGEVINMFSNAKFEVTCFKMHALNEQYWIVVILLDKSVQSELRRTASNSDTIGSFPFVVVKEKSSSRFLTLQNVPDGQECVFVATSSALGKVHKAGVIAMDVSEGGLGVSICKNNELKIWETDTGNVRVRFECNLVWYGMI